MKVSVITVCKNAGLDIDRTARSVVSQTYLDLDWVIVDGGSTDGTLDRLDEYASRISSLVSEPDEGISDAFNKGIALATGDALVFMNAGDHFAANDSLERMVSGWDRSTYRWLAAGGEARDESGKVMFRRTPPARFDESFYRFGCQTFHPSVLIERSLFEEFGPYDLEYSIAMDYELWLRLIARGVEPQLLPVMTSVFYLGGASGNKIKRFREDARARDRWGFANAPRVDAGLFARAAIKDRLARHLSVPVLYRVKERFGF